MRRTLAVVLALVTFGPPTPGAPSGEEGRGTGSPAVVVVGSLVTVRPGRHPAGASAANLLAARNEFESFQVVVEAGSSPVGGLRIRLATALHGPGGTIPRADVTISREAYVDLRHSSDLEGGTGRWPDPLIPAIDPFYRESRRAFPVTVPPDENRVAWVDVLVPRAQAAGRYDGSLAVTADGGFSVTVPIHLTVLALTLPSTSSLKSTFGMEWDGECLAHTGGNCFADEAEQWQLKSLYVRAALEDRITISYPAFQPPSGDGAAGSESASFRRYILPLLQGHAPRDPAALWTDLRLPGARLTEIQVDSDPSQLADWKREAAFGGFTSRAFLYACDEPNTDAGAWADCKDSARAARQRWPGLRVLITGTIQNAKRFDAVPLIDLLVPIVNEMHDKPGASRYAGNQRPAYDAFDTAQGPNEVWTYTSCESHGCSGDPGSNPYWAGWPSYVVDQPGSEHRAMGFLAFEYRTAGDLYFDTDYALKRAWTDEFDFGGNGDGTLFYPGRACPSGVGCIGGSHDIPVESIRLKRIRDGREDYEYLRFLSLHGRRAEAMEIARDLFPTMYRTNATRSEFAAARARLADLIAEVTAGPRSGTRRPSCRAA